MNKFENFVFAILSSKIKKTLVLLMILLAFIGSLMMFPSKLVLAKMLPGKSANTFSIYVDLPLGSSIQQTQKVNRCIVEALKDEKEIENISIFNGMGSPLDYAGLVKGSQFKQGEHLSEIVINLTDKKTRDEESFMMVHRLRPEVKSSCQNIVENTSIKMVEEPAGPPTQAAIVIELYGENEVLLQSLNKSLQGILESTEGLVDVDTLEEETFETFELRLNKEKIAKSSLSIKQINEILYLAFEGMEVAVKNSEDNPEQIPLFLSLSDETKRLKTFNKTALKNKLSSLKLMNKQGMMVPLNEFVKIEQVPSKKAIMSKNLQRMVVVEAQTDMVSQVYPLLKARDKIKKQLADEYEISNASLFNLLLTHKETQETFRLVWDGEMKITLDTFADLGMAFITALIVIFLLMVTYYKSFALSGIVLLGSFLSIIGVIVGHWFMDVITEHTFFLTATSMIGFIALMGISSRNSLLLIDFSMSLIEQGVEKRRAVARAAATRAKPIFLTAVTIVLASIMLTLDPIFGGLGVALIFGSIVAVIVSLILVPILMDNTSAIQEA